MDVDYVISTMTMSYNADDEVYTLDKIDAEELKRFVTKRNVQGSCTRYGTTFEVSTIYSSFMSFWVVFYASNPMLLV